VIEGYPDLDGGASEGRSPGPHASPPRFGPVPRRQLSRDHAGPQLPLGQVVRRVHTPVVEEPQQVLALLAQALGQPPVVRVGVVPDPESVALVPESVDEPGLTPGQV